MGFDRHVREPLLLTRGIDLEHACRLVLLRYYGFGIVVHLERSWGFFGLPGQDVLEQLVPDADGMEIGVGYDPAAANVQIPLVALVLVDKHLDGGQQFEHTVPHELVLLVVLVLVGLVDPRGQALQDLVDAQLVHVLGGREVLPLTDFEDRV